MLRLTRRALLAVFAAAPLAASATADAASLASFLAGARDAAREAGVPDAVFARETAGLVLDPVIIARSRAQGEFSLTPRDYLARLASPARIAAARRRADQEAATLAEVERRFAAPREIVVAFWSLESGFGGSQGDRDVLRTLATLGALGATAERRALFRDEFVAALAILARGEATRGRLKGSWAGAMGQPQFMPSSYLKYAVALAGDGAPDIWTSSGDSLASIGNFMRQAGWTPGLPAVIEVAIPETFDWAPVDLDLARWRALGFRRLDGGDLPGAGEANLFVPAGARGPALLVTSNFEAIRAYNTSDAYALAVFALAEGIAGRPGLATPWPNGPALDGSGRRAVQQRLREKGFYAGVVDGRFGRATRRAVHAWQMSAGVRPADGFASPALLERLGRD